MDITCMEIHGKNKDIITINSNIYGLETRKSTKYNQNQSPALELTHNWDPEEYNGGRNFGHLAYRVKNIYSFCEYLMENGIEINIKPIC